MRSPKSEVVFGGQVERALPAGSRRAESAAHTSAKGDVVGNLDTPGNLTVDRGAEVLQFLNSGGGANRPGVVLPADLDVAVDRDVAAVPYSLRDVFSESVEAIRPGTESLRGVGADLPRRFIAADDLELLVTPLGAAGQVDHVAGGIGKVKVGVDLLSCTEKQFGSSKTCWRAAKPVTTPPLVATLGQLAEPMPRAWSTSPMRALFIG